MWEINTMEKVAPNSNLLGILLKIIRQSKIKGTLNADKRPLVEVPTPWIPLTCNSSSCLPGLLMAYIFFQTHWWESKWQQGRRRVDCSCGIVKYIWGKFWITQTKILGNGLLLLLQREKERTEYDCPPWYLILYSVLNATMSKYKCEGF